MNWLVKYLGYILVLFGLLFVILYALSLKSADPQTKYLLYSLPVFAGGLYIIVQQNKSRN